MHETHVRFYSDGAPLAGLLRTPDGAGPWPGIVQGPGWLGLKDAALYRRYHEAFTSAGFAVLVFDYRGFGDSGGDRGALSPRMQLEDLGAAVTFLTTRPDIDATHLGVFGSGGTGGGNAVLLMAADRRVSCGISQVPVADGEDWLRRMRTDDAAWRSFLDRLAADRRQRVLTGSGARVHPREEITIPTPERRRTSVKRDVDGRIPTAVPLAAADELMAYRPIDVVPQIAPRALMVVAVENDDVTPTDHATSLYDRAGGPKKLIVQRNTTHYAAYERYGDVVIPHMVEWYRSCFEGTLDADTEDVELVG